MYPMALSEIEEKTDSLKERFISLLNNEPISFEFEKEPDPIRLIFKGLMPPLMFINDDYKISLWWESFVRTYLERDLRELSQIESLIDFKRLLHYLSMLTANLIIEIAVSRNTSISQPTVHRYLKLLEVSNIIVRLLPYFSNRLKRIVKKPKVFFIDPGLCSFLAGFKNAESLKNSKKLGNFFENLVFHPS